MDSLFNLRQLMVVIQLIVSLGMSVETIDVQSYQQKIYTVKATNLSKVNLEQTLSQNQLFGFDSLSAMSNRYYNQQNSFVSDNTTRRNFHEIGVNGMFYDNFGSPAGILIREGELITSKSINTPMVLIDHEGVVRIEDVELSGFVSTKTAKYPINQVNGVQISGALNVYTPWFGTTNRMRVQHTVVVVKANRVTDIITTDSPYSTDGLDKGLHKGDFLVVYQSLSKPFPIVKGDFLEFTIESTNKLDSVKEGFQTGGWLVNEGVNVAKSYEAYIGRTDSLQPRTAIGITAKNEVIIKVVDGRQTGGSRGVTGVQLADLFIAEECVFAAYLDGGASTTLVKNGQVVNSPSLGEEKKISHGLFFTRDYSKVLAK